MKGRGFTVWQRRPKGLKPTRCVVACLLLAVAASGCDRNNDAGESTPAPRSGESASALPPYPSGLSAESSPTEVAQVLIQALDADDNGTLLGLVAVNHEMAAVDAIHRKHGRRSRLKPESVSAMTAAGWRATYAFFQENETRIERETVKGDTAEVFAAGKTPVGKARTLKINLLREGGLWKVRAGLESLP